MRISFVESLVRTHDPDRFLASLYFPPEIRAHLCALYAFNHEIAKTREVVTDTHIGLIRLQWWRDALAALYEKNAAGQGDVMQALTETVWRFDLPRTLFDHMIYAREFDLEDRAPGSLEGLCNYADFTHTPLLRLGVMAAEGDADHAALQPVAIAYALAGLIRAAPAHAAQGRNYIPENVSIREVRERAQDFLRQSDPAGEGKLIRLHRVMAGQYLNKIKRLGDNPAHPALRIPPLFRSLALGLAVRGQ